jgi:hypothetical protein
MLRCLPTVTLFAARFILVAMFLVSMGLASHAQDHQGIPPARTRTAPMLESLPHDPLPRGDFKGWCGQKDRYLLAANGQFEAYDAGVKYATIAVSSDWPWQCSSDGERLVYIDTRMGYVTRVDIARGDSRLLTSYQQPERENTVISFSTDLQSVATTAPNPLTEASPFHQFGVRSSDDTPTFSDRSGNWVFSENGASVPAAEPRGLPALIMDQIRRQNAQAAKAEPSPVFSDIDPVPFLPDDGEGSFSDRLGTSPRFAGCPRGSVRVEETPWTLDLVEKDTGS